MIAKDILPLLAPIVIVQFLLLGYSIVHILKHDHYKMGNRALWLIVCIVGMNFIGPILYLLLGREDA